MALFDARHKFIFARVGKQFLLDEIEIQERIRDLGVLEEINSFFKDASCRRILFLMEKATGEPTAKQLHFATDGTLTISGGTCLYFLRTGKRTITTTNIDQETIWGMVEGNLLQSLQSQLSLLFPAMQAQDEWGELTKTQDSKEQPDIHEFFEGTRGFIHMLRGAVESMGEKVVLKKCPKDFGVSCNVRSFRDASRKVEIVLLYEDTLRDWIHQLTALLQHGMRVRKEDEGTGPTAELDYWRMRMARFNSVTDQLRSEEVKIVSGVLRQAQSSVLEEWGRLDAKITDAANEAKDNVKYLYTLEKFYEHLYKGDPVHALPVVPGLMNAVKVMYSISNYYNTSERMTSLLMKITNQMIICCKTFMETFGNLFEQDRERLVEAIEHCCELREAYRECYHEVKFELQENPQGRQFEFSEAAIFGPFDDFITRMEKIKSVFLTISQLAPLEQSVIDGVEPHVKKYQQIVQDLKRRPQKYYLDHRNTEFDKDLITFEQRIKEIESDLSQFLKSSFESVTRTDIAIQLLRQFNAIFLMDSLKFLLDEKYVEAFEKFGNDLERIRNVYEKQKENPPVAWNMPPVAGSILWARQLMRKIEVPMAFFHGSPAMVSTKARQIIKMYNRVGKALVQFENLWYEGWCRSLESMKDGLHATLLVRHPTTRKLYVNFDRQILQLLREAKTLFRCGFEIPDDARLIVDQEARFSQYNMELEYILDTREKILEALPRICRGIAKPLVNAVESKIGEGLRSLTWTSVNIDMYLHDAKNALNRLDETVRQVVDIVKHRVLGNWQFIKSVRFVDLSQGAGLNLQEFLELQQKRSQEAAHECNVKCVEVLSATQDIIQCFMKLYSEKQKAGIEREKKKLMDRNESRTHEAVIFSVRESVKNLRLRVGAIGESNHGVFRAEVALVHPDIVIVPSLEEIQVAVNKTAKTVLESTKNIWWWGCTSRGPEKFSMHNAIGSSRSVVKTFLQLTGTVEGLKRLAKAYLSTMEKYIFLWKQDRRETVESFLASKPDFEGFELEVQKFHTLAVEAERFPENHELGSLVLDLAPVATSIKSESTLWKQAYGSALNDRTKATMEELSAYIEDTTTKLNRKISDLDDINQTMTTLSKLRSVESEIETRLIPIEETHMMLTKYHITISQDEQDQLDVIRFSWKKLISLSRDTMAHMREIAPGYRRDLLKKVEIFVADAEEFNQEYIERGPGVKGIKPRVAVDRLKTFQTQFEERESKMLSYQMGEQLFGLPQTEYPNLVQMGKELKLLARLYDLYTDVIVTINGYEDILWSEIDIDGMGSQLQDFQGRCRKMPKALREWDAYNELKQTIDDFNETLPLLQGLRDPAMRDRHWEAIGELCGKKLDYTNPEFKLKTLFEANLLKHQDDVEDITSGAGKEAEIEAKLGRVKDDWIEQEVVLSAFKNRGDLTLKPADTSELLALIEDTLMTLGSLQSNRYNRPFRKDIQLWVQKLTTVQEVVELWLQVQALWIYLEAVFSGGDIARQLPQEAKRFQNIDKSWVKIMLAAAEMPNVIKLCYGDEMLRNLLPHLLESLEICQKSLSGYLEAKRQVFPRFYFVSDGQLLEILGQGSDAHTIQPHLLSIFSNIAHVEFDKVARSKILAMESAEGEHVELTEPLMCEGNIEDWLNMLVRSMQETVCNICANMMTEVDSIREGEKEVVEQFFDKYAAQIGLLAIQILWTIMSEEALIKSKTDKGALQTANKQFQKLLAVLVDLTTRDMSKMGRTKIETLITIHIHQVDIFASLVKQRIRNVQDFEWLKQTRFYWKPEEDKVLISITDVDFQYCWEYIGCRERLVITPLTDRIYISCAQAMGMYYGGAPAGPAGTGKTETVKDMGASCGRYFITINCSDQMDYRGMGKLFKGIAQSGIWCGFDEINRVHLEVLSVVAAQIQCVFLAMRDRLEQFTFVDGTEVALDSNAGVFITMNPGYAGRTELPENMKALFRTIAVVVPDRQIIMRVKLAASGFQENMDLSKKFFILYRLCEEQLSKQTHYDFGLRNILSVLRTCGSNKRINPDATETSILMRVLRDMNLSKLVDEDVPLFLSLIADLFPGVQVEKEGYPDLMQAISDHATQAGLICHEDWVLKIIQFYEQWRVRHGLCVMGPSGAGKTSMISTLAKALSVVHTPVKEMKMNPKAITATQMFGRLDVQTNDWTDGIFSALWRRACKRKEGNTWVELDGPVDAIWIENLNTVLDDTRTLTLANGDRLVMPPSLKLIFEVGNLDNASPATVSRMGMVYMGPTALGWTPVLKSWLQGSLRSDPEVAKINDVFTQYCEPFASFVQMECESKMAIPLVNLVSSALRLLRGLLPYNEEGDAIKIQPDHVEKLAIFAFMWSIGGLVELNDRKKVDVFFREKTELDVPKKQSEEDIIYDYVVDDNGNWVHWQERVVPWEYPSDTVPDFHKILVPTVDSVRTEYLVDVIARQKLAVLLIGESGTAKTVTVKQYLEKQDPDSVKSKMIAFSSATLPGIFQRTMEASVEKRMGTSYGPPPGKRMVVFVDDINMPEVNEWGDQVTNEIVRQLVEEGGFYSLDRPGDWLGIVDVSYLAAMNHPGGGRNDIPSRLKRHFNVFNVTLPSPLSVENIYGTIATGHFCASRAFSQDVIETAKVLPSLTRQLWEKTKTKMLPTPSKFHYIFNLRDLSRIFQGMLIATAETIVDKTLLLKLWKHECCRVIPDKFNAPGDFVWFDETLRQIIADEFPADVSRELEASPHFVDFLREEIIPEDENEEAFTPKIYEPIQSWEQLQARLEEYMVTYNDMYRKAPMNLVLFEFAMEHLIRISRVIRTPRGNALLVGVGGSGKQSLTRLASFIAGYKTFQIVITKTYSVSNLFDDLKALYRTAAIESPVVFLFTDNEIKEEGFLEYINMILTSGEISGLFPRDELDMVIEDIRPIARKEQPGIVDTSENLYKFFIDRVRNNLHVVLCFSPVGEKFRSRARKFPGLISGCTIDWFPPWPPEALHATASRFLSDFSVVAEPKVKEGLTAHICQVHDIVVKTTEEYFNTYRRHVYVTPKSYLSFINSYKSVYQTKHEELKRLADSINSGLAKLLQAEEDVSKMKVALIQKEKDLAVAQEKTDVLLAEIREKAAIAEVKKNEVQKVKDQLESEAREIEKEKTEAEGELAAAKPALEAAEKALDQIKAADIATLKKLGKPPNLIKRIMDGVLLLRGLGPMTKFQLDPDFDDRRLPVASWESSVRMMGDMNFLQSLKEFNRDTINDETCELLMPYLEMEDFTTELAKKSSGNAAGLCTWVRAMVEFHSIAKVVEPKRQRVREAQATLNAAMKELKKAQDDLDEKQKVLDVMMEKLDAAMKEKQRLQDDAELTKSRLIAAEKLIEGLSGEKVRWTQQSKEFDLTIKRLVGDVALACAFLSYAGPFNQEYRLKLLNERWKNDLMSRGIPRSESVQITKFLADENTIGEWNLQGLPTDELSVQNGIIVTTAERYPLLIDPQGQAKNWIKNREEPNGLITTTLSHKMFRQHLEDTLSQGRPFLIEDVGEELDPLLDPLLERQFVRVGRKLKVRVGDKEIDLEKGFMLYMTTKLANPRYTPEIAAKTSMIDFTVTMRGLEDQLLGRTILKEKADLEETRKQLLEEINQCKKTVAQCEKDLLERLSSSKGNLLDDSTLIDVLNQTKQIAQEVAEKLQNAETTEQKISTAREEYRPVATRGSVMYFVITELSLVNVMYQTSLDQFLDLFDSAIDNSEKSPIAAKRIRNIIEFSTFSIYKYIQRGLYEKDKMMYSLLLTLKLDLNAQHITPQEFGALLKGGASVDISTARKRPFSWIPENSWLNLIALTSLPIFVTLLDSIVANEASWKTYFDAEKIEDEEVPEGYDERLTPFQKLLMVRSWREDRTMPAATQYIMSSLGQQYVEGIPLIWEETWKETSPHIPVICLLSMGSDPTSSIEALAKRMKIRVNMVSMGQGQEAIARKLVANGIENGGWILLQNCHLGLSYFQELEETLMTMQEPDPSFRLWITTESHPDFPINFLQMSIKLTNEPPRGMKAGLRRSYAWINQDLFDAVDRKQWRTFLYATCFLHSTVIERKKFGPLGWCVPYEFNQTDLEASLLFLQNHLYNLDPKKGQVSWSTVRYMICEVQYGGRITDDYDKRLLVTYGSEWLSPDIFNAGFEFYTGYGIPELASLTDYRASIDDLPLIDTPEIFGMHPNAELTFNAAQAQDVLGTILDVQPKDSGGAGGETREDVVMRLSEDLLSKLPPDYNKPLVKQQIKKQGGPLPLNVFLGQEIDRIQVVISLVRKTLQDLQLAIQGTIIMSADLQDALNALYDARVPPKWLKVSWQSPTLGYWFGDVLARVRQYTAWLNEGRPKAYWLTGFFNPQGFLTAMKQESTRKHVKEGWSLDAVNLKTEVLREELEQIKQGPDEGVYIYGLFLEGAAWDKRAGRLVDAPPKVLFSPLPVLHVSAVGQPVAIGSKNYVCPVYRLPRRTDLYYVCDVILPTADPPKKWVLRGVAILCSRV